MQIQHTIEIDSSPEAVFAWLATPEKARVWMKSVSRTELISETPGMVGTTFTEVVEEDGKGIEMQGVITRYEPNQSIAFHLSSRLHQVEVQYTIEKRGTGVRVVVSSRIHWNFPVNLLSLFMGSKMKRGIKAQLQEEFQTLKALCELRPTTERVKPTG